MHGFFEIIGGTLERSANQSAGAVVRPEPATAQLVIGVSEEVALYTLGQFSILPRLGLLELGIVFAIGLTIVSKVPRF